jgi:tetrapyrrole methylase family protein / MazG family protein
VLDALIAEARIRWGLDPADGLALGPMERLAATPIEPSRPLLVVPLRLLRADGYATAEPLPGRHSVAAGPIDVLRRLYPPDHPVGRLGAVDLLTVADLAPEHLAGPLYLGPVAPETAVASPWAMPWIADRLRRPDGCPWDREQTHESLRKNLLEEAYEVYDALEGGSTPDLAEELGDLYLQIVLHSQIAAEAGVFDLTDVQASIGSKIVRRHPHVFGDAKAATAGDVNRQWEQIKKGEREAAAAKAGADASADGSGTAAPAEVKSALDGVPRSMPALAASQEMQERAAHLGYDWPEIVGIIEKIHEELAELEAAVTDAERHEEVGDLLLVTVNLARRHGVDAESALRAASAKFRRRFRIVERLARERGALLRDMSFAELDQLWDAAKAEERAASRAPQEEEETGQ